MTQQKHWTIAKKGREAAVSAAIERIGVKGITALLDELIRRLMQQEQGQTPTQKGEPK